MKRRVLVSLTSATVALGACGGSSLEEARHPTGSQTIAASSNYSALYVASEHDNVIAKISVDGDDVERMDLEGEPSRVARIGTRLFVTLRNKRAVAVIDEATMTVEREITVGAEPVGIVANEAGTKLFVAASTENQVREIDAVTFEVTRSWDVTDQPRWLALHPSGKSLYVASAMGGVLTHIRLDKDTTKVIELPKPFTFTEFGQQELTPRLTGDPAVTPNGKQLVVPGLWVDNVTEIRDGGNRFEGGGGGYDRSGRFNPVVVIVDTDNGDGDPAEGDQVVLAQISTFSNQGQISGYPTAVTVTPDSKVALISLEGAGAVVAMTLQAPPEPEGGLFDVFSQQDAFPRGFESFQFRSQSPFITDAGPAGAAVVNDNQAFVFSFIDRRVSRLDVAAARAAVGINDDQDNGDDFGRTTDIAVPERVAIGGFGGGFGNDQRTTAVAEVTAKRLPAEVERGRKLFFAANDSRMATVGAGVSCATCHFRGRNDGLSWTFSRGPRNTPSLAGEVSLTEPVRWDGSEESVASDAMTTSQGLMGGQGLTVRDTLDIQAFVDWTRDVDVPLKGVDDEAVARGKLIFERPDVACADCHNGPRYTDNKSYDLIGLRNVQTRSLVGLAASGPYFHDGSAKTIREVLELSRTNQMGNTSNLSAAEMNDLEAYLKSL